jgi:hypothetical protein
MIRQPRLVARRAAVAFLLAAAACTTEDLSDPEYASRRISATATLGEMADAIADARCDRELRCGRLPRGRADAALAQCKVALREDSLDVLYTNRCENGVDAAEAATCLAEIRLESCDTETDELRRLPHCSEPFFCVGLSAFEVNR